MKNVSEDFEVLNQPIRSYTDYISPIVIPCQMLGSEVTELTANMGHAEGLVRASIYIFLSTVWVFFL